MWLGLIERYPIELALLVNTIEPEYKEPESMFEIVNDKNAVEITSFIEPLNNIIISTPATEDIIKEDVDGTLNVTVGVDLNVTSFKPLNNNLVSYEFYPAMKIAVPKGIKLTAQSPYSVSYYHSLYQKYTVEDRPGGYLIYKDFYISIVIDLNQLRKTSGTMMIKTGVPVCNLQFTPIQFIGETISPVNIEKTIWVKNIEIFNTFTEVF